MGFDATHAFHRCHSQDGCFLVYFRKFRKPYIFCSAVMTIASRVRESSDHLWCTQPSLTYLWKGFVLRGRLISRVSSKIVGLRGYASVFICSCVLRLSVSQSLTKVGLGGQTQSLQGDLASTVSLHSGNVSKTVAVTCKGYHRRAAGPNYPRTHVKLTRKQCFYC